jgi:hypothetical protein
MSKEQSADKSAQQQQSQEDPRLGPRVHVFTARGGTKANRARKRVLEILGALGLIMVPVGLTVFKGTFGTILAVLGGILGLACYFTSPKKKTGLATVIEVFEKGVACSQGKDRRELLWNEVVEVTSDIIVAPTGQKSHAIAFEVVAQPPLVLVIGGAFGSDNEAVSLLKALEKVWVPLWCRRARVLLADDRPILLGPARLTLTSVCLPDTELRWCEVKGVELSSERESLSTNSGPVPFEKNNGPAPFPSPARRVAALAELPPDLPLLPAPQVSK